MLAKASQASALDRPLNDALATFDMPAIDESEDVLSRACRRPGRSIVDFNHLEGTDALSLGLRSVLGATRCVLVPVRADGRLLGLIYADDRFDDKALADSKQGRLREATQDLAIQGKRQALFDAFAGHLGTALLAVRESNLRNSMNEFNYRVANALREGGDRYDVAAKVLRFLQEVLASNASYSITPIRPTSCCSCLGPSGSRTRPALRRESRP